MSKSSAINIAVTVSDNGSLTLRKIGDESTKTGDKGEKGFAKMRKGIADLDDSMQLSIPSFTQIAGFTFATTIAGIAGMVAGGTAMIVSAAAQAKEIENLSRLANMGSVEFQNYAFATDSVGVSSEKLADISKDVQDKLGDFVATGGGEFADFFENVAPKIGLTADQLQGLSGPDVLIAVKDAMDQVNLSAEEQIFYLESLGNDASLLIPLLEDEGAALKEQAAQADALGIAISEIDSEQLLVAGKAIKKMTGLFGALKNKVAAELAPVFTDLASKIIDGMTEGAGGVDTLAKSLATGLLQGLGLVIEAMRFFHNGWLGIKLVATATVTAITWILEQLYGNLRTLMGPIDYLFEAMTKLPAMFRPFDVNPFDGIEEAIGTLAASSLDVTKQVLSDIDKTNAAYDKAKGVVDSYVDMVKTSGVEHHETNEKIVESHSGAQETISTITLREIAEREKAEKTAADKLLKANEKAATEAVKLAAEQAKAYRDMYADMQDYSDRAFDAEYQNIEQRAAKYEEMGVDAEVVNTWLEQQTDELIDSYTLKYGTFFEGVAIGFQEMLDNQITWAEAGKDVFDTFANSSAAALSDNLFSVIKGDFNALGEAWKGLWDSMLKKMTDVVAEMAVSWALSEIGGMFEGWDVLHSGIWSIEDDEVPAILQKGEMVIPKDNAQMIRDNFGTENFDQLTSDMGTPTSVSTNLDTTFGSHLAKEYAEDLLTTAGAILSDVTTVGGGLDYMSSPETALGNVSQAGSAAGLDALGITGSWSNWGSRFGSLGAGMALGMTGPLGALARAVAGFAGGILGDLVGDGLDAREFEGFRDAFEDGTLDQRKGVADFIDQVGKHGITNVDQFAEVMDSFYTDTSTYSGGDDFGGEYSGAGGTGSDINNPGGKGNMGSQGDEPDSLEARYGGIFDGPSSGYAMELHDREVVIPLPNGQKVPVDMGALLAEIRNLAASVGAQSQGFQVPAIFLTAYLGGEKIVDKMRVEAEDVFIRKSKQRGTGRLQYAAA